MCALESALIIYRFDGHVNDFYRFYSGARIKKPAPLKRVTIMLTTCRKCNQLASTSRAVAGVLQLSVSDTHALIQLYTRVLDFV
jgi:hypothetical protein